MEKHKKNKGVLSEKDKLDYLKAIQEIEDFFAIILKNKTTEITMKLLDTPKKLVIYIPEKNYKIDVTKRISENLFQKITESLSDYNDSITISNKNDIIFLVTPFCHSKEILKDYLMGKHIMIEEIINRYPIITKFDYNGISKYEPNIDDMIIVLGPLNYKYDKPLDCITFNFIKGQQWNYFHCVVCKINCNTEFLIFFLIIR